MLSICESNKKSIYPNNVYLLKTSGLKTDLVVFVALVLYQNFFLLKWPCLLVKSKKMTTIFNEVFDWSDQREKSFVLPIIILVHMCYDLVARGEGG